ncbi:NAD(P)-dependent oxidoreductase [Curtobacterium citreum]|uniref:NAD(P)-dependent oxidoreductase n=1 Tax=Curtobacterium citreum TaxID=2036 RepID=UPI00254D7889|nr:NAD(P)-dependent oxidoreductase [Curtobacterium citreum]MDK8172275.1 NAD(P)-dependent oxidoreductase [Curtobacterium citreum]
MAQRIAASGAEVHVWSRSAASAAPAADAGAVLHSTPAAVGAVASVVLFMLPDVPEIEDALFGTDGVLSGDAVRTVVVGSTSSPEAVRVLGRKVAAHTERRVAVVDAPVSGGVDGAEAGTLAIMVGGEEDPVRRVVSVLEPCGTPVHLGPLGSGEVAKACNQMIVAATVMALGEATALASRSGLDVPALLNVLGGGYAGSRILDTRGPRMAAQDYSVSGPAKYMVKDLGFALAESAHTSTVLPSTRTLHETFQRLVAAGFGDQDIAVTRAFIEQLDGTRLLRQEQQ